METVIFYLGILALAIIGVILSTFVLHSLAFIIALFLKFVKNIHNKPNKKCSTCDNQAGNSKKVNYLKYYITTYYDFWIARGILRIKPQNTVEGFYPNTNTKYQNSSIDRLPELFYEKRNKVSK